MGSALPRVFQEAGLPAPSLRVDRLTGAEAWLPDCLHSLRAKMEELGLPLEALGDFDTLHERLRREALAFKTTPLPAIVSSWSRVRRPPALADVSFNEQHGMITPDFSQGLSE
jgi:hypothetical protein